MGRGEGEVLDAHAPPGANEYAVDGHLRYEEAVLRPDDSIYALGPSALEPGWVESEGHRTVSSKRVVLRASGGVEGELILTNKTEEQLIERLNYMWRFGAALTVVGIVLSLAGVALHLLLARELATMSAPAG